MTRITSNYVLVTPMVLWSYQVYLDMRNDELIVAHPMKYADAPLARDLPLKEIMPRLYRAATKLHQEALLNTQDWVKMGVWQVADREMSHIMSLEMGRDNLTTLSHIGSSRLRAVKA